jgi:RNA polymerase sigma-70 factor (ECF subfamily)
LIELSAARAPARADASGGFVPLADQDPARWDQHLISRAHVHLRAAHAHGGTTDWPALLTLHRVLQALAPSLGSGVALAAVTAEVDGPAAGLAALDALPAEAGPPAASSRPRPPGRTCWTGSGERKRPSRPMKSRSA